MTNKYEIIKCSECKTNLTIPEIKDNESTGEDIELWLCEACEIASDPT